MIDHGLPDSSPVAPNGLPPTELNSGWCSFSPAQCKSYVQMSENLYSDGRHRVIHVRNFICGSRYPGPVRR